MFQTVSHCSLIAPGTARAILALQEVVGALVGGANPKAADFEGVFRAFPVMVNHDAASFPIDCAPNRPRHEEQSR